ncbi:MAG: hypothetical protein ACPG4Z_06755 [Chitinophagales bacterium]
MKKSNLLFILLGLFAVSFLASCETEDGVDTPLLTLSPSADQSAEPGTLVTIAVTAGENPSSKSKLKELDVDYAGTTEDVTESLSGSTFSATYTFTVPADGQSDIVTFTVTDKAGETTTKSITIIGEAAVTTTDLSAATSFQWERTGSNDGTGLSMFGLEWTSNSATNAIVSNGTADKFVELSSADWTSLTTVEDLTAAIDAATAITTYEEVSATGDDTYDDVLGTKVGTEYYLIHVTSSTSTFSGSTVITVDGEYKN